MNVEITDNSKEVSGAIHQVGQAIADTVGFLQVRKVSAARPLHGTVVIRYSRKVPAGLAALLRTGEFQQQGRRNAARFAASPQVALASPTGGWSFYRELSKTDTFSCTGTQELVQ